MTTVGPPHDDGRPTELSSGAFIEWACPVCGRTGAVLTSTGREEDRALTSLRSHILSADDVLHQYFLSGPERLRRRVLSAYVG